MAETPPRSPLALKRPTRWAVSSAEKRLIPQARLSGPMPWVIAIMTLFTVLAAAAGLALQSGASRVDAELAGGVTVQIVTANPDNRGAQAARALALLEQANNVRAARRVPDDELAAQMEPWLGSDNLGDDIPVPALIDVQLISAADEAALGTIRRLLADPVPDARVQANAAWLRPVFDLVSSLQYLALALIVLLTLATASVVLLAARGVLNSHRETIELVHLMGATDQQISRLFQRRIALDAGFGSLIGFGVGALVLLLLGQQLAALDSGFLGGGGLAWWQWLVLALIPVLSIALAATTARISVMRALGQML